MKCNWGLIFFLFVAFIFLLKITDAYVGLTPAGYSVDYQPNLKQVFTFNFYSDNPDIEFDITATGELSKYVEVSKNDLIGSGSVNVLLKLPKEIETPGLHRIYIEAAQRRTDTKSTLSIVANVRGVIDVRVPYPGKYAETEFSATNANAGDPIDFKLKTFSRGYENILTTSSIEIYNFKNEKIESINLGLNEIKPQEFIELEKKYETINIPAGKYKAVSIVTYGDKKLEKDLTFRLGELFVEIVNFTREFEKGKINPISIDVESHWNDPIENIYAEITILGYEGIIDKITTPTISLNGFEKKSLTGYFNSEPIQTHKFKAKVIILYDGKVSEKIIDLRINREINYAIIGLIVGGIVFVLLLIFLIIWIIKLKNSVDNIKNDGKTKNKKQKKNN